MPTHLRASLASPMRPRRDQRVSNRTPRSAAGASLITVAMLSDMLKRDRERWGMTEAQAARRFRLSIRAYREIESGERFLDFAIYDAICKLSRVEVR
jgi:hypothetical protein